MKVSPQFLENIIITLKSSGYSFISLDRLYEILEKGENVRKNIVFTLDDGYKDNYSIAYPIFKKYDIPFTIYVTTSFPERSAILWWYILEDLLLANEEIIIGNKDRIVCRTIIEKEKAFMKVRKIILSLESKNFLNNLSLLFSNYTIDWVGKTNELALDWENIINLSKDEIVTIAGHTKNHYAFNMLSKNDITKEIIEANMLLESKINMKINHFAYPFGSKNEIAKRVCDVVKKLNFKTATTTRRGNIYLDHKKHLHCLPRIMLTEDFNLGDIGKFRKKKVETI